MRLSLSLSDSRLCKKVSPTLKIEIKKIKKYIFYKNLDEAYLFKDDLYYINHLKEKNKNKNRSLLQALNGCIYVDNEPRLHPIMNADQHI